MQNDLYKFVILCLVLVLFPFLEIRGQANYYRFDHINGLTQNTVNCILNNLKGFIWVGTQQGLMRIHPNKPPKVYDISGSNISGNMVRCLAHANGLNVWIGTDAGLCKYNFLQDSFEIKNQLDSLSISAIDSQNDKIWVGTENKLYFSMTDTTKFSLRDSFSYKIRQILAKDDQSLFIATDSILYLYPVEKNKATEPKRHSATIRAIYKDPSTKNIWLGDSKGTLFQYDPLREVLDSMQNFNYPIKTINKDPDGKLWIGTRKGIIIADPDNWELKEVKQDFCDPNSLRNNDIQDIVRDTSGAMWVGTFSGGVSSYNPKNDLFKTHIKHQDLPNLPECIGNNFIWSIVTDHDNNIYLGTRYNGLLIFDQESGEYKKEPSLGDNEILSIIKSKDHTLWVGTRRQGLFKKNPFENNFNSVPSLKNSSVMSIQEGSENDLWLGTSNNGLFRIDVRNNQILEQFNKNDPSNPDLSTKPIYSLLVENDAQIWIGTYGGGLVKLTRGGVQGNSIKSIFGVDPYCTSKELKILCLSIDQKNSSILWIGSSGKGLYSLDTQQDTFLSNYHFNIDKANGSLSSSTIYGIIPDKEGLLWISTNNGLNLLNPASDTIAEPYLFKSEKGIQNIEWNAGAYYQDSITNLFYFGGIRGFNYFDPIAVKNYYSNINDPVVVTQFFSRKDKVLSLNGTSSKKTIRSFANLDTITKNISWDQLPLHIDFSTLNYSNLGEQNITANMFRNGKFKIIKKLTDGDKLLTLKDLRNWGSGDYHFTLKASPNTLNQNELIHSSSQVIRINVYGTFEFFLIRWKWTILTLVLSYISFAIILARMEKLKQEKIEHEEQLNIELEKKISSKTMELTQNAEQLQVKKEQLEFRQKRLLKLPTIINDISLQGNKKDICKTSYNKLLTFFDFDYCGIALGEYLTHRINFDEINIRPEKQQKLTALSKSLATWKNETSFNFNSQDILASVFRNEIPERYKSDGKAIRVNGDKINGVPIDWKDENCPIDQNIYEQNDHQHLNRYFFRVARVAKKIDSEESKIELPLGVVEVGYYQQPNKEINPEMMAELELFIDNIAQPYYVAYEQELRGKFNEIYQNCSNETEYRNSYQQMLNELTRLLDIEKAMIGFLSLNEFKFLVSNNKPVESGLEKTELDQLRKRLEVENESQSGLLWHVLKTGKSIKSQTSDELYLKETHTQLICPLIYQDAVIGAACFWKKNETHFDDRLISHLEYLLLKVTAQGYRQKLISRISALVSPFSLYANVEETYKVLIDRIQKYLFYDIIGIWEKIENPESEKPILSFLEGSQALKSIPAHDNLKFIDQDYFLKQLDNSKIKIVNTKNLGRKLSKEFNIKKEYKSIICIPLKAEQGFESLVLLFSSRNFHQIPPEDKSILSNITSKASMSILSIQLFNFFNDLSANINLNNPESILSNLLKFIKQEMNADQVILHWHDKSLTTEDYFRVLQIDDQNNQKEERVEKPLDESDLVKRVLGGKEDILTISSKEEYYERIDQKKRNKHKDRKFDLPFFIREKLHAMAALRLMNNEGVLFINYRTPTTTKFNATFHQKIRAFGFITVNSIREYSITKENQNLKLKTSHINKEMQDNTIASEILHNSGNLLDGLVLQYNSLKKDFKKDFIHWDRKKIKTKFEECAESVERLQLDVNRFSNYRGLVNEEKEVTDLYQLINEAKNLLHYTIEKRKNLKLDIRKTGPNPKVFCKKRRIHSVLVNIILNAIQAIDNHKGTITITTDKKDNKAVIIIRDDGPGIKPEQQPYIFDLYYSTKLSGTGIGLSSSKYIIEEEHNGSLELGFENRKGATFKIILPIIK